MNPSQKNRNLIIERLTEIHRNLYDPECENSFTIEQERAMVNEERLLKKRYEEEVPKVPIAICPFCKTVLKIGVDIYGFDGLYWSEQGKYHQKVNSCDHYVEHDQALHFHNRIPTLEETGMNKRGILIGPEVPYINPILMEQTGIQGIISQVQVADWNYTAYFTAYFSENPIQKDDYLSKTYNTIIFPWTNAKWDFDIQSWLEKSPDTLWWMQPNNNEGEILRGIQDCPFIHLPGSRNLLYYRFWEITEKPTPNGNPTQAMEDFSDAFDA